MLAAVVAAVVRAMVAVVALVLGAAGMVSGSCLERSKSKDNGCYNNKCKKEVGRHDL